MTRPGLATRWKRELVEKAKPFVGENERVRVVALAQASVDPWLMFAAMGAGAALAVGGLFRDTYLPTWLGIVGLAILFGASAASAYLPRRLLLRTNGTLFVFELPRSRRQPLASPLHVAPARELPPDPGGRSVTLFGERLWGHGGTSRERSAISAALARELP